MTLGDALAPLVASSDLLPARSQMAFTLGFHIVLASMGVAFPAITLIANYLGLRRGDSVALALARRWSKVMGVLFAIEGLFFFTEAIFIAIYIYGWRRLPGWAHFWTGVPILVAGLGGALSVVSANAWMNQPQGFTEV